MFLALTEPVGSDVSSEPRVIVTRLDSDTFSQYSKTSSFFSTPENWADRKRKSVNKACDSHHRSLRSQSLTTTFKEITKSKMSKEKHKKPVANTDGKNKTQQKQAILEGKIIL